MVCTANIARSPLFTALLQHHVDQRLGKAALLVGSAGVDARAGQPAADGSKRIAEALGLSLDAHRSRSVRFTPLESVELIVTMTRRQRDLLAREHRDLAPKTFTLLELVAALEQLTADDAISDIVDGRSIPIERLRAVVVAADRHRPRTGFRRRFDVPDPIGGDAADYQAMGEAFTAAGQVLADTLFGPYRPASG